MAEVSVTIHGKAYGISCDDGQERRVQELAKYVDTRLREIAGAGAASNESHLLVLTALVLADEVFDAKSQAAIPATQRYAADERLSAGDEEMIVQAINHLAARIDSVSERLHKA